VTEGKAGLLVVERLEREEGAAMRDLGLGPTRTASAEASGAGNGGSWASRQARARA
jgi:hypothetical protein